MMLTNLFTLVAFFFFFQAEDGIRDAQESRGLGDVYKRQLLYECISTATTGISENKPLIELCTDKLRGFVAEPDPNLKFLGLVGLCNVIKVHPRMIAPHKDVILSCLDDEDVTIRMRVLELLAGMASKKNLPDICRKLREHIDKSDGQYRDALVRQLVKTCSQDTYEFVTDFEWYAATLLDLSMLRGLQTGSLLAEQLMDIAVRVEVVRPFALERLVALLHNEHMMSESATDHSIQEVLFAASWIIGEFATVGCNFSEALTVLLQPRIAFMPAHVQGAFVQAAFKVFVTGIDSAQAQNDCVMVSAHLRELLLDKIAPFTQSVHMEVQERACSYRALSEIIAPPGGFNAPLTAALAGVFAQELIPVSATAQSRVKVPPSLDLENWINEEPAEPVNTEVNEYNIFSLGVNEHVSGEGSSEHMIMAPRLSKKELRRAEKEKKRLLKLRQKDPFYLANQLGAVDEPMEGGDISVDEIPISKLDLSHMEGPEEKRSKKKKKKGKDALPDTQPPEGPSVVVVKKFLDEPSDVFDSPGSLPSNALDIDVSAPLRKDEVLKEVQAYEMMTKEDVERKQRQEERQHKREEKEARRKAREDAKLVDLGATDMLDVGDSGKKKKSKKDKKSKKEKKERGEPAPAMVVGAGAENDFMMGDLLMSHPVSSTNTVSDMDDLMASMDLGGSRPQPASDQERSSPEKKSKKEKKPKKEKKEKVNGGSVCSRISSGGGSKDDYEDALTNGTCASLASCKIKLPKDKIQMAIEQIAVHLQVEMVDCIPGAVSFFGKVDRKHALAVLIKARSSGVSIEVRSYSPEFVAAVLEEAKVCASKILAE
eukprot:TRINITY_DN2193_c0_g3_i1.p1 TRINITY_DN2193_c0_g3~~TRINITY_DN2193_c0_g3_i1.p1  ORF type:complete len:825 (-),score=271.24 TRINITY_DN2193_c0_g3_i1:143-2617(-)